MLGPITNLSILIVSATSVPRRRRGENLPGSCLVVLNHGDRFVPFLTKKIFCFFLSFLYDEIAHGKDKINSTATASPLILGAPIYRAEVDNMRK